MSNIIEQSRFAREMIGMDLNLVISSFEKFLELSASDRDLILSPKNYNAFSTLFQSINRYGYKISSEDVINVEDWKFAVDRINIIDSMFREHNGFLNHYFTINKKELTFILSELKGKLTKLENSPVREDFAKVNSDRETYRKDQVSREQKSLGDLIKEDIEKYEMFLEDDLENIDLTEYHDFILFSFVADKNEVLLSPLNKAFGEYLLELDQDDFYDIDSYDLGDVISDLGMEDEYKGEYEFTAVVVTEIEEEITITTRSKEITKDFDDLLIHNGPDTLGRYFYNDSNFVGAKYVHIKNTRAPADMAGIILLKERVNETDISKEFGFYAVSGQIVGMKYREQIYSFNLGNVYDIDNNDTYVVSLEDFLNLKEF